MLSFLELKMHCERRANGYELEGPTLSVDRAHEYYKSPTLSHKAYGARESPQKNLIFLCLKRLRKK